MFFRCISLMKVKVKCNLCGQDNYTARFEKDGTRIVQCKSCGLVYTNPQLCNPEIYEKEYFMDESSGLGYSSYIEDRPNIVRTAHRELEQIERLVPKESLLDVGCAAGFFLLAARERGWNVNGIELSAFASAYAKKELGVDVSNTTFSKARIKPGLFGVVTMWDYIEHSFDPRADIRQAAKALKKGGLLVIGTPDVDCLSERIFGSKWMQYKPREHTYFFSRKTLSQMLREEGFEVKRIAAIGKYISFSLFAKRLTEYNPYVGKLLASLGSALHLGNKSFYANPFDTMRVYAFKNCIK